MQCKFHTTYTGLWVIKLQSQFWKGAIAGLRNDRTGMINTSSKSHTFIISLKK